MEKEILGRGWKFPFSLDLKTGGIRFSAYEEKIQESILIILGTAKGERIMRPDFGCGIHDFVFSVLNSKNITMIKSTVKDALIQWEPRMEVLDVTINDTRLDEGILDVRIDYKVISTNNQFNLVYPFYLRSGR